jgi:hypothetical protein
MPPKKQITDDPGATPYEVGANLLRIMNTPNTNTKPLHDVARVDAAELLLSTEHGPAAVAFLKLIASGKGAEDSPPAELTTQVRAAKLLVAKGIA